MDISKDWRLTGQESYLTSVTLYYKKYSERTRRTDHDHCEFCWAKFSDTIPDALKSGYATYDDKRWICEPCFSDFKEHFKWIVK